MKRYSTNRSRLNRKLERKSKRNLLINLLGIIITIFLLAKFGLPLLINFTLFISGSKSSEQNIKQNDETFIPAPILNPMPSATNSAQVLVIGSASPNQTINLYINGSLVSKTKSQKNGDFSFRETLEEKDNKIKAKAVINDRESDFSQTLNISFINSNPTLKISSPSDGDSFSKDQNTIDIKGETDPQVKITVNDFWAITDQSNHFSYNLPLKNGDNQIKIVAVDQAGNKTEKEIKVTYNP